MADELTGTALRELQDRHGKTDEEMALLLGMSPDGYRDARNRRTRKLSARTLGRLEPLLDGPAFPAAGEPLPGMVDELPTPPADEQAAHAEDEPEPEPKPRRRRSSSRQSGLTAWQDETAGALTALIQGTEERLEVGGQVVPVRIPGAVDLIAQLDGYDAQVVYAGTPALAVALVKIAPRHPWLKQALEVLTSGGEYRELTSAVLAIAVPIALHHGMMRGGEQRPEEEAAAAAAAGDGGEPAAA